MDLKKVGYKNQGHCYSKREEARLPKKEKEKITCYFGET